MPDFWLPMRPVLKQNLNSSNNFSYYVQLVLTKIVCGQNAKSWDKRQEVTLFIRLKDSCESFFYFTILWVNECQSVSPLFLVSPVTLNMQANTHWFRSSVFVPGRADGFLALTVLDHYHFTFPADRFLSNSEALYLWMCERINSQIYK